MIVQKPITHGIELITLEFQAIEDGLGTWTGVCKRRPFVIITLRHGALRLVDLKHSDSCAEVNCSFKADIMRGMHGLRTLPLNWPLR